MKIKKETNQEIYKEFDWVSAKGVFNIQVYKLVWGDALMLIVESDGINEVVTLPLNGLDEKTAFDNWVKKNLILNPTE